MIRLTGPLNVWTGADGSSHFMSIPDELSGEIRAHGMLIRRGFGSVKVEVTVGGFTWRTSVFPSKSGGYFLPVKREACRNAGIVAGDIVEVEIDLV